MIDRYFQLDLADTEVHVSNIAINQGNVDSVTFRFRIFDGGKELDYGIFSSARATFSVQGRTVAACDCTVSRSEILCTPPKEAFMYYGTVSGQLDLGYAPDINLATNYFVFIVTPNLARLPEADKIFFYETINSLLVHLKDAVDTADTSKDSINTLFNVIGQRLEYLDDTYTRVDNLGVTVDNIAAESTELLNLSKSVLQGTQADAADMRAIVDDCTVKYDALSREYDRAISQNAQVDDILQNSVILKSDLDNTVNVQAAQMMERLEGIMSTAEDVEQLVSRVETASVTVDNMMQDAANALNNANITQEIFIQALENSGQINEIHNTVMEKAENIINIEQGMTSDAYVKHSAMEIYVTDALSGYMPKETGFQYLKFELTEACSWWRMMPDSMYGTSAASCAQWDGKAYFMGMDGNGANNIMIQDLVTNVWSVGLNIAAPNRFCCVTAVNGRIFLMGGEDTPLDLLIYDTESGLVTNGVTMRHANYGVLHCGAAYSVHDNRIYVIGDAMNTKESEKNVIRRYEITTNAWSYIPIPVGLGNMDIAGQNTFAYGDHIYCAGSGTDYCSVFRFVTSPDVSISGMGRSPRQVGKSCILPIGGGRFIAVGGGAEPGRHTLIYDANDDSWTEGPLAPLACQRVRGFCYNGAAYFYGDFGGNNKGVIRCAAPPSRIRLVKCNAGDRIFADYPLITDFGQFLPALTENVINANGYVECDSAIPVDVITGWIERG